MGRRGANVSFSVSPRPPKHGNIITSSGLRAWAYGQPHNRIIYINHGLARHELYSEYPKARSLKAVLFPGQWWKNHMRTPPLNRVVGWPKTDILFDSNLDIAKLRKNVGVPDGRLILYASSWCNFNMDRVHRRLKYAKALSACGEKLGFNILLKPHPGMSPKNFEFLKKEVEKLGNVYVIPLHWLKNIIALFPLVEALTSEHSGSLMEFLAVNKPAIQLTPWFEEKKAVGAVFQADINNLTSVFSSLKPHPEVAKWRKLMMGKVDGKASERAANFIEKVFQQ